MEAMRLKEKKLEDIVGTITCVGYKEEFPLYIDDTKWMVYTKNDNKVVKVVYASEASELFTAQTFQEIHCRNEVEKALYTIVGKYQEAAQGVEKVETGYRKYRWICAGAMAVALAPFFRLLGLVVGISLGYLGAKYIKHDNIKYFNNTLRDYLKEHNVLIGEKAYRKLTTEKRVLQKA